VRGKLATIYHNLAVMFDAGLPILRTLDTIGSGLQGHLRKIFSDISNSVSRGNSLADSMAEYPKVFAGLDVMLVKTAEMSGELPNCFKMLSNWYEFRNRIKGILISGLILPILIFHIMVFIVPLPSMVLGRLSMAGYMRQVAIILCAFYLLIGITLAIYHSMPNTGQLRRILDAVILRIPLLGRALRELSISRYCKAFNMLYKAGVPIRECAAQALKATGNLIISELFEGGAASVAAGNMTSEGFSRSLPLEYLNLWQTGEQSGELDKMIDKIAEIAGDKAEHLLTEFARWLPKLAYALVCLVLIILIFKTAGLISSFYSIPP
jgi:type II secretory pathway component PulF